MYSEDSDGSGVYKKIIVERMQLIELRTMHYMQDSKGTEQEQTKTALDV